jgi:hypothetical protein
MLRSMLQRHMSFVFSAIALTAGEASTTAKFSIQKPRQTQNAPRLLAPHKAKGWSSCAPAGHVGGSVRTARLKLCRFGGACEAELGRDDQKVRQARPQSREDLGLRSICTVADKGALSFAAHGPFDKVTGCR